MNPRTTFTVANHVGEIARAAELVEAFGREHAVPERALFDVNLSLDEILTNIISYGYEDDFGHDIVVRLELGSHGLRVEVEDGGRPFDPLAVPAPDLAAPVEDRPVGGLGLCLVRQLMTDLAYERRGDRNVFTMTRRFEPATARAQR